MADDDLEDQEMLCEAIKSFLPQATIITVKDGTDVIGYLETCNPSEYPAIIILDYQMPLMNAAAVLARIGHEPRYQDIGKIILSTSCLSEDVAFCLGCGASHYFRKAVDMGELNALAKQIVAIWEERSYSFAEMGK